MTYACHPISVMIPIPRAAAAAAWHVNDRKVPGRPSSPPVACARQNSRQLDGAGHDPCMTNIDDAKGANKLIYCMITLLSLAGSENWPTGACAARAVRLNYSNECYTHVAFHRTQSRTVSTDTINVLRAARLAQTTYALRICMGVRDRPISIFACMQARNPACLFIRTYVRPMHACMH